MEEFQSQLAGRIVLDRVRNTRPIRSFITKKLVTWLQNHGIGPAEQPVYQVALNRTPHGHWFTCRIEVDSRNFHWEAMVTEPDLHQSILSALNHLTPHKRRLYALATP